MRLHTSTMYVTCIFYVVHTTYSHYGSTRTCSQSSWGSDKEGVYNWCTCIGVHTTKPSKHQTWPCFLSTLLSFSAVRACGGWVAWGRNITKGNSAVRIRYIPTDLAAIVTPPERSQVQKLGVTVSKSLQQLLYSTTSKRTFGCGASRARLCTYSLEPCGTSPLHSYRINERTYYWATMTVLDGDLGDCNTVALQDNKTRQGASHQAEINKLIEYYWTGIWTLI